jgi:hypothetical protein
LAHISVNAWRSSDHSIDKIGTTWVRFWPKNVCLSAAGNVGGCLAVDLAEGFDHFGNHFEFPTQREPTVT